MMDWDLQWLLRINREWTHPLLDWLMPAVSSIHAWLPLLVLAGLWLAWRGGREGPAAFKPLIMASIFAQTSESIPSVSRLSRITAIFIEVGKDPSK